MKKINLFIFEEHHEAFFVWNYAVIKKILPKSNNVLLHVDQHSDMAVPKFSYSIKSLQDSLSNIYQFTYSELNIGNFIFPAIYQGIFRQLYWLYQTNNEGKSSPIKILVYSQKGEGRVLKINSNCDAGTFAFFNPDLKNVLFNSIKTSNEFPASQSVVLDIDLDYFSCNPIEYQYKGKLEVTKEQYDSFNKDKYHFLRLYHGNRIKTQIEDEKYYLAFNFLTPEFVAEKLGGVKVSKEEIVRRIELFIEFLIINKVEPQLIDICRSRLSGFTPEEQGQFIEEKLIEKLSTLYELEIKHITEIFSQEKLETEALAPKNLEMIAK
jgi:hypothetical protein